MKKLNALSAQPYISTAVLIIVAIWVSLTFMPFRAQSLGGVYLLAAALIWHTIVLHLHRKQKASQNQTQTRSH